MKFLVIEDHALTREGMRLALGRLGDEDLTVLEATSVAAGLDTVHKHGDIDLVLLDVGLPGAAGFSMLAELRREMNTVPVVVVSGTDDRDQVLRALELGASGFIPKSSSMEVMLHALRLVLAGSTFIPLQALEPPRTGTNVNVRPARALEELTARQKEILALMARGKPNKVIGDDLQISEATVKAHVTEILRVLGVTNRTQAVIVAGESGIT